MPKQELINIWTTQEKNYVNGYGCRFVLWVQGCHLVCDGCWNEHTWDFDKKNLVSIDDMFIKITSVDGLDGVTFTGGEPFIQAKSLVKLAQRIKTELNLSIQIFTGFELHELNKKYQKELLSLVDVLVAGRFDSSKPDNNQKVYQLSDEQWQFNNSDVEIEVGRGGGIILTGYPKERFIESIKEIVK
ncbi:MAG: radical SAM protein [Gammaproteobacteria bacterium]|nr:radical SAM protein [Gammaproteobacteria bacterium]